MQISGKVMENFVLKWVKLLSKKCVFIINPVKKITQEIEVCVKGKSFIQEMQIFLDGFYTKTLAFFNLLNHSFHSFTHRTIITTITFNKKIRKEQIEFNYFI